MKSLSLVLGFLAFCFTLVAADTYVPIPCNATTKCPEKTPCCSQYGTCGVGSFCLGGCDIRYSHNLSACMPMPMMLSFSTNFTSLDILDDQNKYLGNSSDKDWVFTGSVDINDDALLVQMPNNSVGTVISSTKYLWYGKISANLKTSHDAGVITAFILFSDVQDEIDFEFVGYNLTAPQTNFYALGVLDYNNAKNSTTTDTFANYHNYEIDWHEDHITWLVDGQKVRTLYQNETWNETTNHYDFPATPSRIQMSLWPGGGAGNGLGTIEWAGGSINWDSADIQKYGYYYAYLKDVEVKTYDLPAGVKGAGNHSSNAFLYNSTDGNSTDIYLTNKKTWLGNFEATGFNPDNDDEPKKNKTLSSTTVISSGSDVTTKVVVNTNTAAGKAPQAAQTTDNSYDTSGAIGGFVQNSQPTADGESVNENTKNEGVVHGATGFVASFAAAVFGALSFLL